MKSEGTKKINKITTDLSIGKTTSKGIIYISYNIIVKTKNVDNKYKNTEDTHNSVPQTTSLVKYDTPFLVSTTISNKKTLEELDENNENAEIFLRNLINKRGGDVIIYLYPRIKERNQNTRIIQ